MASIIYTITYNGKEKKDDINFFAVSFCWKICMHELLFIKTRGSSQLPIDLKEQNFLLFSANKVNFN